MSRKERKANIQRVHRFSVYYSNLNDSDRKKLDDFFSDLDYRLAISRSDKRLMKIDF